LTRRFVPSFPSAPGAIGLVLLVALVVRLGGQGGQNAPALSLISREARRAIPLIVSNEQEFIGLDELATTFQLAVREESGAATVSYKGRTIVFSPDQTIASVAGRMISLPARPVRVGGRLAVPVDFISRAIAPIYDQRIELRRASHLLIVGDVRVPRVTITPEPLPVGIRLTIDAAPQTTSALTRDADQLIIRFDADAIDVAIPPLQPQPLIQAIRRVDAATLAIDLGPRFASYRSTTQAVDAAMRLTVELLPPPSETTTTSPAAPTAPAPPATAPVPAPPAELPTFAPPGSAIRTVTLDPGHGGTDTGTRGAGGLMEKTVTLTVARRVKASLEARLGLRVLLTREDDHDLPFDARTAVANNNKADLFISLHANAAFRPTASGASVLVASFPDEGQVRQSLEPQRVPVFGGGLRDIELVLWNQAQIRYVDQSSLFARTLEEQFQNRVPLDTRPTDRVPLRVLASANMPAVVVELGYLSNPEQEKQLAGSELQSALAQSIVDAVVTFRGYLAQAAGGER
jgi:N-acetylmuramoyl-L-alanine amidase